MLKKLSLDQTKTYEQTVATYEIAKMLVFFIRGRSHYLAVGAEQGNIDTWDDLVIEDNPNHHIHIQIKKQYMNFSDDNCIRDSYTRGKRMSSLRDLSTIDKPMKALAEWLSNSKNDLKSKVFRIELPTLDIQFKKDLTVRHFKEFQEIHYKPEVTTVQGLEELAQENTNVKRIYNWLTTWCSFKDWEHILKLLSVIKIESHGSETDIKSRTNDILREVFITDKIDEVWSKIRAYTSENTTFTGAIKPRSLFYHLKAYLQPNTCFWTQYSRDRNSWSISGINDVESNQNIERPEVVVPQVWNSDLSQTLKVNNEPRNGCKMTDSLLRMIIHQSGNSKTHCQNIQNIKSTIDNSIGKTLGISPNDTESLSITENTEIFISSESRQLRNSSEGENCSYNLEKAMNIETWTKVSDLLYRKIAEMENQSSTSLRDKIEERWQDWNKQLNVNQEVIGLLFEKILHPEAEGQNIKGKLRVGPKTAQVLADSLFFLLIISISLDPDNTGNWKTISNKYNIASIGLKYWSGRAECENKVRNIDEDGIVIAGREQANIIVFSNVESSPNELMEDLIGNSNEYETNSIASGKTPNLVITNCRKLRLLIKEGDFDKVKKYVLEQLKNTDAVNKKSIREVAG